VNNNPVSAYQAAINAYPTMERSSMPSSTTTTMNNNYNNYNMYNNNNNNVYNTNNAMRPLSITLSSTTSTSSSIVSNNNNNSASSLLVNAPEWSRTDFEWSALIDVSLFLRVTCDADFSSA
jgi:hypothetical protein